MNAQKTIDAALWVFGLSCRAIVTILVRQPRSVVHTSFATYWHERATRHVLSSEWSTLNASGVSLGKAIGAPVVLEFADYQCPFCRTNETLLDSLRQLGLVRVEYFHAPQAYHAAAAGAAIAAICADEQGRFGAMHATLMTTNGWQRDTDWVAVSRAADVPDTEAFVECLRAPRAVARLERDKKLALRLHVAGTPTFFTKDRTHQGMLDLRSATWLLDLK